MKNSRAVVGEAEARDRGEGVAKALARSIGFQPAAVTKPP